MKLATKKESHLLPEDLLLNFRLIHKMSVFQLLDNIFSYITDAVSNDMNPFPVVQQDLPMGTIPLNNPVINIQVSPGDAPQTLNIIMIIHKVRANLVNAALVRAKNIVVQLISNLDNDFGSN